VARERGKEETKDRATRRLAVVLDTNIVISSLIKPGGFTRSILLQLEDMADLYVPRALLEELAEKTEYLARKKGVSSEELRYMLSLLFSSVETIESDIIKSFIKDALNYVRDPDDAPFVALAFYLRSMYREVIILTWNVRDYKRDHLGELKINVLTPRDILVDNICGCFS